MVIVLAAVLSAVAFLVLVRLLWPTARPGGSGALITAAAAVLVLGLAVLALTGRLHWLAAVAAAVAPFLRRGIRLARYLPWLRAVSAWRRAAGAGQRPGGPSSGNASQPAGPMTRAEALEILGLGATPSRNEILAAHRRLIQKLHPDRGGTSYLAQKLNDARRRLLEEV